MKDNNNNNNNNNEITIRLPKKAIEDLNRIAIGLEISPEKTALVLLKKIIKQEIKMLKAENDEVFQQMLHDHIHPSLHHQFHSIDDIISFIS